MNIPCFSKKILIADVAVIGAGSAGIAAALIAARSGLKVVLVTDRSILGGNASSEARVNPHGASYAPWNRFARETGIMEEIFNNVLYRAEKKGEWSWNDFDATYFDLIFAEKNITLVLNTYIDKVEKDGDKITAVEGSQSRSETLIRAEADIFIDASGDGTVGFLAGCNYRTGAESKHQYGEFYAPNEQEAGTMGTTLLFTSKDTGRKTEYNAPKWAVDFYNIKSTYRIAHSIFPTQRGVYGGFWWLEYGGELDTIADDNDISMHLRKAVYGLWDFIKNSGLYPVAETHELDWIAPIGGKRESRRLMGEHIVSSPEIVSQTDYFDNIGYAGWPLDIHPKEGYKSTTCGCTHYWLQGPANMPARMLISKDVKNLLFAGRNVSCTREAMGSLRLICTTAVMGQAAGTIATLAHSNNVSPIDLVNNRFSLVEQKLLKDDQRILGRTLKLENDLAKTAKINASSQNAGSPENGEIFKYADKSIGLIVPCDSLEYIELLLSSDDEVDVNIDFYACDGKPQNYRAGGLLKSTTVKVGEKKWYKINAGIKNVSGGKVFVLIQRMPPVRVYGEKENFAGFVSFSIKDTKLEYDSFFEMLNEDCNIPFTVCCRYPQRGKNYSVTNIADGHIASYASPKLWMSAEMSDSGESIELDLGSKKSFSEIELVFNSNLNSKNFNPLMNRTSPELIKNYAVYTVADGKKQLYFRDKDNFKRFVRIEKPAEAEKVIIEIFQTRGSRYAQIFDVRINK